LINDDFNGECVCEEGYYLELDGDDLYVNCLSCDEMIPGCS